jgi:hypothetical protein
MSDSSPRSWLENIRRTVLLLLGVAAGVRIAWALVAPAVPVLVSLAVRLLTGHWPVRPSIHSRSRSA